MGTGVTRRHHEWLDHKWLAIALSVTLATSVAFVLLHAPHCVQADGSSDATGSDAKSTEKIDPMSVNATCYICHMTFVREPISRIHFKAKVTCIKCHGLSSDHANDEDVGATKPDNIFKREKINAMCVECHKNHDVPAGEVIARFLQRKPTQSPLVCSDCHGQHRIEPPEEEEK